MKSMNKKLFIIGTIAVLIVLLSLLWKSNEKMNMLKMENSYLKIKSKADSLLLDDKYDMAMIFYSMADSISSSNDLSSSKSKLIEQKISKSQEYDELANNLDNRSKLIKNLKQRNYLKEEEISALTKKLDSLELEFNQKMLSLDISELEVGNLEDNLENALNSLKMIAVVNQDGVEIKYVGHSYKGKAEGFGYAVFDKKGFYEGEWDNNMRNGLGKYYWTNGDIYEGEYRKGIREGVGVYYFESGEKYIGEWKNNLRHGKGKVVGNHGKVLMEGNWEEDKFIE